MDTPDSTKTTDSPHNEPLDGKALNRAIIALTSRWIDEVVLAWKLCPFAKAPVEQGRVAWYVSYATDEEALAADLLAAIARFVRADSAKEETAFLIHPFVLTDFLEYNDFLDLVDVLLEDADVEGIVQVASFHPGYLFADTPDDAVELATNRSPFPMLHLLREDGITRAIAEMESPEALYERNIAFLQAMDPEEVAARCSPLLAEAQALLDQARAAGAST